MSEIAQIIITIGMSICGILVIGIIGFISFKVGIKITSKKGNISIGGKIPKVKEDNKIYWLTTADLEGIFDIFMAGFEDVFSLSMLVSVERKMSYVEDKLKIIIGYFEKLYIKLSDKLINPDILCNHSDYHVYLLFIQHAIYEDTEREGIKLIIKKHIKAKDYDNKNYDEFINSFTELVLQIITNFLKLDYSNQVYITNTENRIRTIRTEDLLVEFYSDNFKAKMKRMFSNIFLYAIEVDKEIEKERLEKTNKRKEKIHLLACNKTSQKE